MSVSLVLDAAAVRGARDTRQARDLFPLDGEFCVAMAGLCQSPRAAVLPDVVYLELYAYEFVERSREFLAEAGVWRVPFWPASLFVAADVPVHAGRELENMLPEFDSIELVARGSETTEQAARAVLGALRFDVAEYYAATRRRLEARR